MKKFFSFFVSKRFILCFSFFVNLILFFLLTYYINSVVYSIISIVVTILAVLCLIGSNDEPIYKITWALAIAVFPLFGTVLYLYLRNCRATKRKRKLFNAIKQESLQFMKNSENEFKELENLHNKQFNIAEYLKKTTNMSLYKNTSVLYLKNGETYFKELINDLKTAEKYILLQYYIIEHGKVWDEILKVLKERSAKGVEIKILYDDFGCMDKISRTYFKNLKDFNIEAIEFNKCNATINKYSQYRDHRKLCVIDGKIGYVGGINLADEYANIASKFGYWKDTGVRLEGEAVWGLIVLFSDNWKLEKKPFDIEKYKVEYSKTNSSYVQPFGSGPLYVEPIARNNYVNMINSAKQYVYICTPYLLLDTTTIDALKIAAKSGVDVRIIMPGIPDKKFIWYMGRAHYKELVNAGVKIYEFKPGFVHAKMVIVDDMTCCVGTINFDFRSLYLHFENGVLIYNDKEILNIKQDFIKTINKSVQVTTETVKSRKWYEKVIANVLRFFAPLM